MSKKRFISILALLLITSLSFGFSGGNGIAGNALSFDGVNDFVRVPNAIHLDGMSAITIEAWFNPLTNSGNSPLVWKSDGGDIHTNRSYEFLFHHDQNILLTSYFSGTSGWTLVSNQMDLTANEWVHLATTFDSNEGNAKIFVNGKLVSLVNTQADETSPISESIRVSNQDLLLGAAFSKYFQGSFTSGFLDEIRIWNYARDEQQILQYFNRIVDPESIGLIAYFNFDEDFTEQNVYDLTNYSNHGTLGNSSSIEESDPTRVVSNAPLIFFLGDGTAVNPYQISTREDLEAVNNSLSSHYILMNDIDLGGITYDRAVIAHHSGIEPEFEGTPFTGTFNGNDFSIKNLTIDGGEKSYIGLFGQIDSGSLVERLGIIDINLIGGKNCGGIAGKNNSGFINKSFVGGTIDGRRNVGGIVGKNNNGTVEYCYILGNISSIESDLGGIAGRNDGAVISNCYSFANLVGAGWIGGIAGQNSLYGIINNSFAVGSIFGTGSFIGGVSGQSYAGEVINSFWDMDTSEQEASDGGTGKTTAEMQDINTFLNAGWDFEEIWLIPSPHSIFIGYPILKWQQVDFGDGTPENPYQISTIKQIEAINLAPAASYELVKDLDFEGLKYQSAVIETFSGTLNGNGYTLKNIIINDCRSDYAAAFGIIEASGRVENLGVVNIQIDAPQSYYVGTIAGWTNGLISGCYSSGNISGDMFVGGISGGISGTGSEIINSYSTANITAITTPGGVVSYALVPAKLTNCYFAGTITSGDYFGGVVTFSTNATVTNTFFDTDRAGFWWTAAGQGKTTAWLAQSDNLTASGWDYENTWQQIDGQYPILQWQELGLWADFDGDGVVGEADLVILASQWLQEGALSADISPFGGDGVVNFADFATFADWWLRIPE